MAELIDCNTTFTAEQECVLVIKSLYPSVLFFTISYFHFMFEIDVSPMLNQWISFSFTQSVVIWGIHSVEQRQINRCLSKLM